MGTLHVGGVFVINPKGAKYLKEVIFAVLRRLEVVKLIAN